MYAVHTVTYTVHTVRYGMSYYTRDLHHLCPSKLIATGLEGDPTSLVEIGGTERFRFL